MQPISPMLASASVPFSNPDWIFEPKFDGYRCIAHISGEDVLLQNRRLAGISGRYPEIVKGLQRTALRDCILDGEIVILKGGRTDFPSLQARGGKTDTFRIDLLSRVQPATFIVFDILYEDGHSLMKSPLLQRKERLTEILDSNERVEICRHIRGEGELFFKAYVSRGMEGIIAKKNDSLYYPGKRSHEWLKFKHINGYDLIVAGYTGGKGVRRKLFGALILCAYDNSGNLIYAGKVGSGFSESEISTIKAMLNVKNVSPLTKGPMDGDITWVSPDMVVEVKAQEITADKKLRAPVFLRIKPDKPPEECRFEQFHQV